MKLLNNTYRIAAMMAVLVALAVPQAHAQESNDSYRKLVYRWHSERDDTVKKIVHSWLRGATAESLKADIVQVISLDVRLANEDVELYVPAFRDPRDLNMSVADLVHQYLSRLGVITATTDFFSGKSFKVIREEQPIRGSGHASSLALRKWEKK